MKITKTTSSFILVLAACTALSACQTSQNVSDANLRSSSLDSAIERAKAYNRKPSKSIAYLERVYKKSPNSEVAAVDYAAALREQGKLNTAEAILSPFAKEQGASSLVTSEYAAVQLADGSYEAAEKYAQKAVLADDSNYKAYHRLGISLDAQALHEEAERAYRKGLELWQGDPTTIMNNLALNLATQGYLDEAVEILQKAHDVSPRRTEIERNLRIVTALKQADGAPTPKPRKKPKAPEKPVVEAPKEDITEVKVKAEPPADIGEPEALIKDE